MPAWFIVERCNCNDSIFAGDEAAEAAINKAITDVSNKMKQSEADDQSKTDERNTDEVNDTGDNKIDVKADETPEQVKDAAETGNFLTTGIYFQRYFVILKFYVVILYGLFTWSL